MCQNLQLDAPATVQIDDEHRHVLYLSTILSYQLKGSLCLQSFRGQFFWCYSSREADNHLQHNDHLHYDQLKYFRAQVCCAVSLLVQSRLAYMLHHNGDMSKISRVLISMAASRCLYAA